MLDIIIQAILAIFLLLIMGFLAYSIFDREYINFVKITTTNRKRTNIFTGIYEFSKQPYTVETINKKDPRYLDLNPSVNQNGGAEYSYNFWLYYNIKSNTSLIDSTEDRKYIVLFYKGLRNMIPYKQYDYSCDTKAINGDSKSYLLVKNPLVKLSNDGSHLIVEYNNVNSPDTFNSSSTKLKCTTIENNYDNKENKLGIKDMDTKLFNKTYNMVTIVMQESPKDEDELFVNRTNCKVYLNGTLISNRSTLNNDLATESSTDSYTTVMRKNIGFLHINPFDHFKGSSDFISDSIPEITEDDQITKDVPLKMADLTYFNYALNGDDVLRLYNNRFNTNVIRDIIPPINPNSIIIGEKINQDIYDGEMANAIPVKSI